jgi:hypothetical protein
MRSFFIDCASWVLDGLLLHRILAGGKHTVSIYIVSPSNSSSLIIAASSTVYFYRDPRVAWPSIADSAVFPPQYIQASERKANLEDDHDALSAEPRRHMHKKSENEKVVPRSAAMLYHRNLLDVYPKYWIDKCIRSVLGQTFVDFDVFELDYGDGDNPPLLKAAMKSFGGRQYVYMRRRLDNHIQAMNTLLDEIFNRGYEVAFNVNLDDYYAPTRFEKQIRAIREGAHLVSTYFALVSEACQNRKQVCQRQRDVVVLVKGAAELFGGLPPSIANIRSQLVNDHNVICHPSVAITKQFWTALASLSCRYEAETASSDTLIQNARSHIMHSPANPCANQGAPGIYRSLRYKEDEFPAEDLRLWQRAALMSTVNISVIPEVLTYYRSHSRQLSNKHSDHWYTQMHSSGSFQNRPRVGILTVCTGRYVQYMARHIQSILHSFLPEYPKFFFVFTDDVKHVNDVFHDLRRRDETHGVAAANVTRIACRGYPADTLYRYHYILMRHVELLALTDMVFYMDVDLLMEADIDVQEVAPTQHRPLVAVRHPLQDHAGTPETRPESAAYVPPYDSGPCYVAGGFVGGRTPDFLRMAKYIAEGIDRDDAAEVVAIWHDESHLNMYMAKHTHLFRILPPAYLYPDTWDIPYERRIVVQRIPHDETRYAREAFVGVCGIAEQGQCQLTGGLGSTLFMVAAAIGAAESLSGSHQVVLPLNWCFQDSHGLCSSPDSHVHRVSYRDSWLWGLRRSDSYHSMNFTPVLDNHIADASSWSQLLKAARRDRASSLEQDQGDTGNQTAPAHHTINLLLVGSFRRWDLFHPFARNEILGRFRMPDRCIRCMFLCLGLGTSPYIYMCDEPKLQSTLCMLGFVLLRLFAICRPVESTNTGG